MREVVEMQRKRNEEKVREIEKYAKPFLKKKETTTFEEFKLSTEVRSEKHSEFRKQNMEKLEEKRELERARREQTKKEEQIKCQKILKHFNHSRGISENSKDGDKKEFVSLKSQLEKALTRKEQQELLVKSPAEKIKPRQLTTPHSPTLSVKKRCEFAEKTKQLKTTEELEIEMMSKSGFKARPCPSKMLSGTKIILLTPSVKKTEFKEFKLSQVKKKQLLTTEELELQSHSKEFKASELNKKMFEKSIEDILGKEKSKLANPSTVPVEFNFKTTQRKRDRKAQEKDEEDSKNSQKRQRSKIRKYKEFTIKKNENFKPTCPKSPVLNTTGRKRQKQEEEVAHTFKAIPVPDYDKLASQFEPRSNQAKLPLTKPVEFNFSTE
jgi:hypothetical protein